VDTETLVRKTFSAQRELAALQLVSYVVLTLQNLYRHPATGNWRPTPPASSSSCLVHPGLVPYPLPASAINQDEFQDEFLPPPIPVSIRIVVRQVVHAYHLLH